MKKLTRCETCHHAKWVSEECTFCTKIKEREVRINTPGSIRYHEHFLCLVCKEKLLLAEGTKEPICLPCRMEKTTHSS